MPTESTTGPHRPDCPVAFGAAALVAAAFAAAALAFACLASGCAATRTADAAAHRSDAAAHPLVIGERIRVVQPGETLTVPAPRPPARVWYLADDEGLWQWLGIRAPNRTFITNADQRITLRRRGQL